MKKTFCDIPECVETTNGAQAVVIITPPSGNGVFRHHVKVDLCDRCYKTAVNEEYFGRLLDAEA